MPKIKCFEEYYMRYDEWFEKNKFVYLSELKAVGHFIPDQGNGLEVGIGSGRFAVPFGIKTGVEPSGKMRGIAERKGVEVFDAVAESLPFINETFDYVLMVTTICFLDDVNKSFAEVKRVLKTGGLFIVGFVDKDSPLGLFYETKREKNVFYKEASFFSAKDVMSLLEKEGFKNPEIIQTVFGDVSKIEEIQDFKKGSGLGGFVVIKAEK